VNTPIKPVTNTKSPVKVIKRPCPRRTVNVKLNVSSKAINNSTNTSVPLCQQKRLPPPPKTLNKPIEKKDLNIKPIISTYPNKTLNACSVLKVSPNLNKTSEVKSVPKVNLNSATQNISPPKPRQSIPIRTCVKVSQSTPSPQKALISEIEPQMNLKLPSNSLTVNKSILQPSPNPALLPKVCVNMSKRMINKTNLNPNTNPIPNTRLSLSSSNTAPCPNKLPTQETNLIKTKPKKLNPTRKLRNKVKKRANCRRRKISTKMRRKKNKLR